jgi:hypothetical protein
LPSLKPVQVISTEGRAFYNTGNYPSLYGSYGGLTYFSPNINIFRDPRFVAVLFSLEKYTLAILGSFSCQVTSAPLSPVCSYV